ncbi:MAG: succinate dehydrogenase/fumarate reductase iron-sulfur subunit [Ignavibacteria bacterium]|nr:succinate dehydrogenase/fumarate reductase iron-sulfur subunit [Ignavibacteria bacterium]
MNLTLHIWRQKDARTKGKFVIYKVENVHEEMSFLEMLDILNEQLIAKNEDPVAFDHDCREGICGCCSLYINGRAHGPKRGITVCQLHMRHFKDGDSIWIEPWRARPFPVLKDLIVDRAPLDRIMQAGGYISARIGSAQDANTILIDHDTAESSMDAAACIGCGACVASCKNASAMLFVAAKVSHLGQLPQGKLEREKRVLAMIAQMDKEGFGGCTNTKACEAECPKEIKITHIARLNREFLRASVV